MSTEGETSLDKLIITGQRRLTGHVEVSGAKNSAVALIPATLLAEGQSVIENVPRIRDVEIYMDILQGMGVKTWWAGEKTLAVDPSGLNGTKAPYDLCKKMRASYYLMGVLLGRFGRGEVAFPGGCDIGSRPIDQHVKGFQQLGATIAIQRGIVTLSAPNGLAGSCIYLDVVSVGATINIMLAAVLTPGTTVIENAAKEPHVVDLANFLNAMGANVKGAGTDVIKIHGVNKLHGTTYSVIPDQIEAGTLMIAAAATQGDVVLENVIPKHLDPITAKLREMGAEIDEDGDQIRIRVEGPLRAVNIKTLPYPGFPTDVQQPMTSLLSTARGTSLVTESIWEGRFKFVDELKRMGANIKVEGRTAIIEGVPSLSGAPVRATDLRAGAALVVAGLMAEGETEVSGVEHIDRGYETLEAKLRHLGAEIRREQEN